MTTRIHLSIKIYVVRYKSSRTENIMFTKISDNQLKFMNIDLTAQSCMHYILKLSWIFRYADPIFSYCIYTCTLILIGALIGVNPIEWVRTKRYALKWHIAHTLQSKVPEYPTIRSNDWWLTKLTASLLLIKTRQQFQYCLPDYAIARFTMYNILTSLVAVNVY